VFPHLEGYYSKTTERSTDISTSVNTSSSEAFTFEGETITLVNSASGSYSYSDKTDSRVFEENETYREGEMFCISGQTYNEITKNGAGATRNTGIVQYAPPLYIGSGSDIEQAAYGGRTYEFNSSFVKTIGSDGVSYNHIKDYRTNFSNTYSATGRATFYGGVTRNNYAVVSISEVVSSYESQNIYEYQQGETRYSNFTSYFLYTYRNATSGINDTSTGTTTTTGIASTSSSYSEEYITTLYKTQESISYFTSQTGSETSQTATTSESYVGRYRHTISFTITTETTPYILSTGTNITFTYLSHATQASGTNSFLTISTYTTIATNIGTTTLDASKRPMLSISTTTSFYQPLGTPATALVNVGGNWANGYIGGYLVGNGNNQNLIQEFSELSVMVSNKTFLPPLSMGRYTVTPSYNNIDSQTYVDVSVTYEIKQFVTTYQELFSNTSYAQQITDSTTFSDFFYTTRTDEDYVMTTSTLEGVYSSGINIFPYIGTVGFSSTRARTIVGGPNRNITLTYVQFVGTTRQLELYSTEIANTSTLKTEYFSTHGDAYFRTYEDQGGSYERQSFNTATAKYHVWIGDNYHGRLNVLGKKHGQYQIGSIYLDTTVSNKTNNTGYFLFSNNIGLFPHQVALRYNANTVITNDNQLAFLRTQADQEYLYANFGLPRLGFSYFGLPMITPISQSSYAFADFADAQYTTYTVSFGGALDYGSYTSKIINYTNSTYSNTGTGIIQFFFGLEAGTGYELNQVNDYEHSTSKSGLGGKRVLYTGKQTLMPITNEEQFVYSLRESRLAVKRPNNYTVIDYFTNTGTGSLSVQYGSILTNSSEINNLKFISLNQNSWIVKDSSFLDFGSASASALLHPYWASSSPIGGLMPSYMFTTYYGSTYFMY
jgi:hypothetical protein